MTSWPSRTAGDGSVVAHVLVVGFHAQLGNRIEFSYPRLRGDPVLRSPNITDTSDISADAVSPTIVQRSTPTYARKFDTPEQHPPPPSASKGDWGVLPDEWSFLPFMSLPDGVHDQHHDVVFFTLPPDVHCVACFRQADAIDSKTHSASAGRGYERGVAARGSVQKSVVLLCRRPLFGVLADRLVPAVRAYFEQADFARTDVLASLYHSLNVSLCRPSLNDAATLFHGLDLRAVLRRLGPQTLAVLKLILLERRVIVYSQPVHLASNAVIALTSILPGALDSIAPNMQPLDGGTESELLGFPLALFSNHDRVVLQPYAPLPLISELIPNNSKRACLIGTSHNVGILLSSTAASAARKAAEARKASTPSGKMTLLTLQSSVSSPASFRFPSFSTPPTRPSQNRGTPSRPMSSPLQPSPVQYRAASPTPAKTMSTPTQPQASPGKEGRAKGGVPLVDALVNLSNGKVSVSGSIEPYCRITRQERRFMRDLMVAAATSSASVSASGATGSYVGSDDYIRKRLREYLSGFLRSMASVDNVLGGPVGGETWSEEIIADMDFSKFDSYNEQYVREWMKTRNAAQWARKCTPQPKAFYPPPKPELDESLIEEQMAPVDRVAAGLSGLRQNVAELGRLSSLVTNKASEGISSFFKRIEQEVVKMDNAVDIANTSNPGSPRTPVGQQVENGGHSEFRLTQAKSIPR